MRRVILIFLLSFVFCKSYSKTFLVHPIPNGFKLAYNNQNMNRSIKEYVPSHESLDNWTRMFTVIELYKIDPNISPKHFLQKIFQASSTQCRTFKSRFFGLRHDGRNPASLGIQYCGKHRGTQQGEVTLIKIMKSNQMLYSVQMAWRGAPFKKSSNPVSSKEMDEWRKMMKQTTLSAEPLPSQGKTVKLSK